MAANGILKKTLLAGLGVYSLTKEKAQDLMTELVNRGELSKDEGSKFVKAMMEKVDEEMAFLRKTVDKQVSQAMSKIRPSYDDEFKKLHQKIDKLAKEVEKLSKKQE
jgi:poly(hydroxyalkanoate) granule-associated protein